MENLKLRELTTEEMKEISGGISIWGVALIFLIVGFAVKVISELSTLTYR